MTLHDQLIAEGKEEGIAIGIEKGKQEGSIQSRCEVARKLIKRNMPIEDICELTSLSREEVQSFIGEGN